MRSLPVFGLSPFLFLCLLGNTRADDSEYKYLVGIDSISCPYGIVACWPEVREALVNLDGVTSVSQNADRGTQTGEVRMKTGTVLNPQAVRVKLQEYTGQTFSLRGVEATLTGIAERKNGRIVLKVSGAKELLQLGPLGRKVQKHAPAVRQEAGETGAPALVDPLAGQDHAPTAEEREAFERLGTNLLQPLSVRVVGPLVEDADAGIILQVREFEILNPVKPE